MLRPHVPRLKTESPGQNCRAKAKDSSASRESRHERVLPKHQPIHGHRELACYPSRC